MMRTTTPLSATFSSPLPSEWAWRPRNSAAAPSPPSVDWRAERSKAMVKATSWTLLLVLSISAVAQNHKFAPIRTDIPMGGNLSPKQERARFRDLFEAGDASSCFEGRRKELETDLPCHRIQRRRWLAWQLRGIRRGFHRGRDRCFLRLGNAGNLHWLGRWRELVTP